MRKPTKGDLVAVIGQLLFTLEDLTVVPGGELPGKVKTPRAEFEYHIPGTAADWTMISPKRRVISAKSTMSREDLIALMEYLWKTWMYETTRIRQEKTK